MGRLFYILVSLITCLFLLLLSNFLDLYLFFPLNNQRAKVDIVTLEEGSNFKIAAKKLRRNKIIKSWKGLYFLARVKKVDKLIKAGEYQFSSDMTPLYILNKLVKGEVVLRKFTIKEGSSLLDIADLLEEKGIAEKEVFFALIKNINFIKDQNIDILSLEGFLFPETYYYSKTDTLEKLVKKMIRQFELNWEENYNKRVSELGFTKYEIITLASIIEKESGNFKEQPKISSVFHNRLKIGMRLQADPTVNYGHKRFRDPITRSDLKRESKYNTYIISGLPPSPICSPGASAIKAALYPDETKYLYFVSDAKGGHVFSTSNSAHLKAVRQYRREVKRR